VFFSIRDRFHFSHFFQGVVVQPRTIPHVLTWFEDSYTFLSQSGAKAANASKMPSKSRFSGDRACTSSRVVTFTDLVQSASQSVSVRTLLRSVCCVKLRTSARPEATADSAVQLSPRRRVKSSASFYHIRAQRDEVETVLPSH